MLMKLIAFILLLSSLYDIGKASSIINKEVFFNHTENLNDIICLLILNLVAAIFFVIFIIFY